MAQKLTDTTDHTSDFYKIDIEANKGPALLSYFGLLVLISIFVAKHSPYVRYHANQGLVLFVGMLVWGSTYLLMHSYMQVAPDTKITFNIYNTLCGLSAKFRELFNKSDIKQNNINVIPQNNENCTTETDDETPRFCSQCGIQLHTVSTMT